MTALANNSATNVNTKRNEKKKEKKRKKEDPWTLAWREEPQRDDPHAQWQTEIEIEHLADIARTPSPSPSPTPPGTPNPRNHEPRRNVVCTAAHHCTMARVTWFRSFTVNPCLQQQWSRGRRTGRRDAVRRSHARRVHPRRQASEVSPWWRHLFACPFCVNCAFFLVCPSFLPHIVHLLVGLFREKGCGGADSEDEGAPGSQGP